MPDVFTGTGDEFQKRWEEDGRQLEATFRVTDRLINLYKTNFNRRLAAKVNLEAVAEAYKTDTVTLDLLLDAQRRLVVAEEDYALSALDLLVSLSESDRKRLFAKLSLEARIAARDRALATWREVKALYDARERGGESEKEAQAREQYFLCRGQVEVAVSKVYEAYQPKPVEQK